MSEHKLVSAKDILDGNTVGGVSVINSEDTIKKYIDSHSFDAARVPDDADGLISLNGTPIGSRENIITITGMSKSRKTVVASALITSIFSDGYLGFTCDSADPLKVLHIDTEQGYKHYYYSVKRIFDNAACDVPDRFKSIHTRDASIPFTIEIIEYLLTQMNPDIVVLDGVTDIMLNINDQTEATEVGKRIQKWTSDYKMLFIGVIHTTKSTGFMTGSIGTLLEKKSETVIKVELDENDDSVSHIHCQYGRNRKFKSMSIIADRNNNCTILNDSQVSVGKNDPAAISDTLIEALITKVLGPAGRIESNLLAKACQKFSHEILGSKWSISDCKRLSEHLKTRWLFADSEQGLIRLSVPKITKTDSPFEDETPF